MSRRIIFILLLIISLPTLSAEKLIKVGIVNHIPFAMGIDNKPSGLAIDIWEDVAKKQDWHYQFTSVRKSLYEGFDDLKTGKVDVLIGAIPVDLRGLSFADFSRPYFINKVGLVVKDTHRTFWDYMVTIFNFISVDALLIIVFVFIAFSHIIWFLERGKTIPESYVKGVLVSFWFAFASFLLRERKPESFSSENPPREPLHYVTRIIVFFWLIASTTILATLVASITSSLTMALSDASKKYTIADFRNKNVAMVEDTDFTLKRSFNMNPILVPTFNDALRLLNKHKVFAIIDDIPTARYQLRNEANKDFMITNVILGYNEYVFAFRRGSDLRSQFDIAFDKLKSTNQISNLCTHYLFMDGAMFCEL